MNRLLNLILLAALLVPAGLVPVQPASAQTAALASPGPQAVPSNATYAGAPAQLAAPRGLLPLISSAASRSVPSRSVTSRPTTQTPGSSDAGGPPAPQAPGVDFGDWTNDQAVACIASFASAYVAAYIFSFVPFYGEFADPVVFAADLALKFCAPYLQPGAQVTLRPADQGSQCTYDLYLPGDGSSPGQNEIQAQYSNLLGIPVSPRYYLVDWGQLGRPDLYHFNTNVNLTLQYPGQRVDAGHVRLPAGSYPLSWRGDTLWDLLDKVYIPSPGPGTTKEQFKAMSKSQIVRKTLKGLIKNVAEQFYKALSAEDKALIEEKIFNQVVGSDYGDPHGVYNVEYQNLLVLDQNTPSLTVDQPVVTVEATEPGGISRRNFFSTLQQTIHASDACDPSPTVAPVGLPQFIPVGQQVTFNWQVSDHGPASANGGLNTFTTAQTIRVVDTKPPVIVAPPSIVTETLTIPASLNLGQPQVFDLVDMEPQVSNDAPAQFPAGATVVHWWATDQSGNPSPLVDQVVNVKSPGTNHTPSAQGHSGANAYQAVSYEPITITLKGADSDQDPLWFKVKSDPPNGFFVAPLLPYFIEDYRVETHDTYGDLNQYCQQGVHPPFEYAYPWEASYVAVDDDGITYVVDNGFMSCSSGIIVANPRIAVFDASGTLRAAKNWGGGSQPKSIYVDLQTGDILVSDYANESPGVVYQYRLDRSDPNNWAIQDVQRYVVDSAAYPPGQNRLAQPVSVVIDHNGILYVTDGIVIRAYLPEVGPSDEPTFLATLINTPDVGPADLRFYDLAVDSAGNLYASAREVDRVYKFGPSGFDAQGNFQPGQLEGWAGRCDYNFAAGPGDVDPHCDEANQRSLGFSCTEATCGVRMGSQANPCPNGNTSGLCTAGSGLGQFDEPRGIAVDPHDVLYVTDYNNFRVQRFTPDGYFAGVAKSACDGTCFILGDFGKPKDISVNSNHFYILDTETNLLHVSKTSPITPVNGTTARITYQSNNNFVGTDSFTFTTSDGLATSSPATVSFNVARNHRPPTAQSFLSLTTDEDTPAPITLKGSDPDLPLDTLSYTIAAAPEHGVLSGSGAQRNYAPDANYAGADSFQFTVSDGMFTSQPATVTVSINPLNDPPVLKLPADMTVGLGYSFIYTATLSDPDPLDEHTMSVDWGDGTVEPQGQILPDGTASGPLLIENLDGTGVIQGEHTYTSAGDYDLSVTVQDSAAASDHQTTHVHVQPMADLAVSVLPSANPLAVGQDLVFNIQVSNQQPSAGSGLPATHVGLQDIMSANMTYSYATPSQGACSLAGDTLTCDLGDLAVGASASIELGVDLGAQIAAGETLHNVAEASADQPDPTTPNRDIQEITLVAPADYIVNSLKDQSDSAPGDDLCQDADGYCTLRAAVEEANARPGRQTIALADHTYTLGDPNAALQKALASIQGSAQAELGRRLRRRPPPSWSSAATCRSPAWAPTAAPSTGSSSTG